MSAFYRLVPSRIDEKLRAEQKKQTLRDWVTSVKSSDSLLRFREITEELDWRVHLSIQLRAVAVTMPMIAFISLLALPFFFLPEVRGLVFSFVFHVAFLSFTSALLLKDSLHYYSSHILFMERFLEWPVLVTAFLCVRLIVTIFQLFANLLAEEVALADLLILSPAAAAIVLFKSTSNYHNRIHWLKNYLSDGVYKPPNTFHLSFLFGLYLSASLIGLLVARYAPHFFALGICWGFFVSSSYSLAESVLQSVYRDDPSEMHNFTKLKFLCGFVAIIICETLVNYILTQFQETKSIRHLSVSKEISISFNAANLNTQQCGLSQMVSALEGELSDCLYKPIKNELELAAVQQEQGVKASRNVVYCPDNGVQGVHPDGTFLGSFIVILAQICVWHYPARYLFYYLRPDLFGDLQLCKLSHHQLRVISGQKLPQFLSVLGQDLLSPEATQLVLYDDNLIADTLVDRLLGTLAALSFVADVLASVLSVMPHRDNGVAYTEFSATTRDQLRNHLKGGFGPLYEQNEVCRRLSEFTGYDIGPLKVYERQRTKLLNLLKETFLALFELVVPQSTAFHKLKLLREKRDAKKIDCKLLRLYKSTSNMSSEHKTSPFSAEVKRKMLSEVSRSRDYMRKIAEIPSNPPHNIKEVEIHHVSKIGVEYLHTFMISIEEPICGHAH